MPRKLKDLACMVQDRIPGLSVVKTADQRVIALIAEPVGHIIKGINVYPTYRTAIGFAPFSRMLYEPSAGLDIAVYGPVFRCNKAQAVRCEPDIEEPGFRSWNSVLDSLGKTLEGLTTHWQEHLSKVNNISTYKLVISSDKYINACSNKPVELFSDIALGDYSSARDWLSAYIHPQLRDYDAFLKLQHYITHRPDDVPALLDEWAEKNVKALGVEHLWTGEKFQPRPS